MSQAFLDEVEWLEAGLVDPDQLRAWEKSRQIFKVPGGYPAYQFDDSLQPLPVIGAVIAETGGADPLALAAWFHYPNGWLTTDGWHPVAPRLALDQPDLVLAAARRRRGTYIA